MSPVQQLGQMGGGRAWCGTSCSKLEVLLLGWECGGTGLMGLGTWWRLALSLVLLVSLPDRTANARVSSSLSTTHHVHHFHNKHGTVPIAINRMPFLTRGGHGKSLSHVLFPYLFPSQLCIALIRFNMALFYKVRALNVEITSHWYLQPRFLSWCSAALHAPCTHALILASIPLFIDHTGRGLGLSLCFAADLLERRIRRWAILISTFTCQYWHGNTAFMVYLWYYLIGQSLFFQCVVFSVCVQG